MTCGDPVLVFEPPSDVVVFEVVTLVAVLDVCVDEVALAEGFSPPPAVQAADITVTNPNASALRTIITRVYALAGLYATAHTVGRAARVDHSPALTLWSILRTLSTSSPSPPWSPSSSASSPAVMIRGARRGSVEGSTMCRGLRS